MNGEVKFCEKKNYFFFLGGGSGWGEVGGVRSGVGVGEVRVARFGLVGRCWV